MAVVTDGDRDAARALLMREFEEYRLHCVDWTELLPLLASFYARLREAEARAEELREDRNESHRRLTAAGVQERLGQPDAAPLTVSERVGALVSLRDEAEARADNAETLIYVTGLWRCAKCGCQTVSAFLHASTGRTAPNHAPQTCPNECGPMWRVTERDAGNRLADRYVELQAKNARLRGTITSICAEQGCSCESDPPDGTCWAHRLEAALAGEEPQG